ncbi:peroxidase 66 [Humulus lupulus]|uniref:peroxidase 66 n=1 Tax=Humulus lupulus TaxID=3486 RepID=UPI002B405619|nr:peroxidase 66 [Humulus lupulus]
MATFSPKTIFYLTTLLLMTTVPQSKAALNANYYSQTCPQAEKIILQTVYNASIFDPKVPARLLRMFFHDCFIRGCDASVLLDSTAENQAEKDGPPNLSLASFYVIDGAKATLEAACPQTVSCADVLAIAARDVVTISGGPYWNVLKGRKDGRVSKASETVNLPAPTFNMSQLVQSFSNRGLGLKDLVALSGGHTLGFSHCSSFESRLRNFSSNHDIDPSLSVEFGQELRKKCPKPNNDKNAGQFLDSTSSSFDNDYYKRLIQGKSVFGSDQALGGDFRTKWIVESFAGDQSLFFREFAASMVKLGSVGVIENGEVRQKCRVVN